MEDCYSLNLLLSPKLLERSTLSTTTPIISTWNGAASPISVHSGSFGLILPEQSSVLDLSAEAFVEVFLLCSETNVHKKR
jgi:hypothetical protein